MKKRLVDITISIVALLLLSPILFLACLIIYYQMGFPVFFRQLRPGLNGKFFELIKLRTMQELKDKNDNFLPDKRRMTRIGAFLRASSIDEVPELWNVLKGEMSIVGPRPLLMEYLPLYTPEQQRRHEVLPGITGWAQVNGRNSIFWEKKFELDVWYVDNRTLRLDFKIICMTFLKVFKREGISQEGEATSSKFNGSHL
ncbi:Sugar transferase involved in LPS biosynthesis (colanic, teichoic acid) [Candidatus Electrothrix aarhusensis]|uniref:Sugar transferase involved in LPS biosynthesis (Colanic, teichoic acid) n=1 Tax=Candidatus Electrothrix aarhusensis TaxID=1859131 RepID=A0A3S3QE33_9BACT|nr:Sugar transferase involved in LPS biosynthesis (colanic, teichoic acid) [Candidatus Electrothrix aarhusensis]